MNDTAERMKPNREIAATIPLAEGDASRSLVPQDFGQVMELAKMMAISKVGVPKHLRGEPAICLRVVTDAMQFGLNPFHLAGESYVVNDQLQYGAKAVHSMVMQSGVIEGRLNLSYQGEGEQTVCTVKGQARGSNVVHTKSVQLKTITTRNSPLWKSDTKQQLGYYTIRAWCRLYAPDAIMGLVSREDPPLRPEENGAAGEPSSDLEKVEQHLGVQGPGVTDAEYEEVNGGNGAAEPETTEPTGSYEPQQDQAEAQDDDDFVEFLKQAFAGCENEAEVEEVWADKRATAESLRGEQARARCVNAYRYRLAEIRGEI